MAKRLHLEGKTYLNKKESAEFLGCTVAVLNKYIKEGRIMPYVRPGYESSKGTRSFFEKSILVEFSRELEK
jgi:hypothetical protein